MKKLRKARTPKIVVIPSRKKEDLTKKMQGTREDVLSPSSERKKKEREERVHEPRNIEKGG